MLMEPSMILITPSYVWGGFRFLLLSAILLKYFMTSYDILSGVRSLSCVFTIIYE